MLRAVVRRQPEQQTHGLLQRAGAGRVGGDGAPQRLGRAMQQAVHQQPRRRLGVAAAALQHAAALLYNHATQDWRDLIPRLAQPTLVVGGRVSTVPWRSQAWVAAQVKGASLEIFEEEEGGNHFMFIEGHRKFNAIVADFVG